MKIIPNKKLITGSLLALVSLIASLAYAASRCGYVYDSSALHVRHSTGKCVITSTWNRSMATRACHPELMPKQEVAVPEPPPPPPPPPPVPKPVPPPPAPVAVYETITLQAQALFDFDRAILKEAGKRELDELASHIRAFNTVDRIRIIGHTDSIGSETYNQRLSMRRALAVRDYLIFRGIDSRIMTTAGMGESQPLASNRTPEGRAQNRRVELMIRGRQMVREVPPVQ